MTCSIKHIHLRVNMVVILNSECSARTGNDTFKQPLIPTKIKGIKSLTIFFENKK